MTDAPCAELGEKLLGTPRYVESDRFAERRRIEECRQGPSAVDGVAAATGLRVEDFGGSLSIPVSTAKKGALHGHVPFPADDDRDARAVHRRAHRLRAGPLGVFGNSADDYLKVHDRAPTEADVTEGSERRLGAPALRLVRSRTASSSRPPTPTPGEAPRATPTPSRRSPTGRPTWTSSSCARARTSRAACSGSCRDRRQGRLWQRRSTRPSRRSKPGTTAEPERAHEHIAQG